MRCGKVGSPLKRLFFVIVFGGLMTLIAQLPASAQQVHRNGFEARETAWLRGEDNVRAEEKAHTLSTDYAHQGSSSEFIQLICPDGKNDANFANYYYPTQPAPIGEELTASVWVKANRAGVQLQARLVLPRERNPKQLDEPMTVILTGDTYKLTRRWQKLEFANPVKLVKDQQQILRAQLRRDVDLTDAYIDRLILNMYTGPGQIDVYIDDLEIGPVKQVQPPQPAAPPNGTGRPTAAPKDTVAPVRTERGLPVRMEYNRLTVGGKPFFIRAIRYTDTPLKTLRDAGFNTVWFDANVPTERIEEAVSHGFWIVPRLPLVNEFDPNAPNTLTGRQRNDIATARDAEALATAITRFLPGDAVLFWDCGGAMQMEKEDALERTARAVGRADPQRPIGVDIWDGFRNLSNHVQMVGTHRFPLMSSLDLLSYRDWLTQRRRLASGNALNWTWIQTHIPDWQMQLIYGKKGSETINEPIGPQPEQIRLLTYIGLASGCRGLAYSSDRFLADSHQGKDRWLMLAMLNQEIQMLEPILLTVREAPTWIDTSHPQVKAAVLRGEKGILVLPILLGQGAQYVPSQGVIANLTMVVPLVPDGAQPWEISAARVQSLQNNSQRKLAGTRITLPEFDLTSAIVFTSDLTPTGPVGKWQNHSRMVAPRAAQWAIDLAAIELQKVRKTHAELVGLAPTVLNADQLLREAAERLEVAARLERSRDYSEAYFEAMRAIRPVRILMRAHWDQAAQALDIPSASPFAVSFYTLPRHWELHRQLRDTTLGANALRDGDFETVARLPSFLQAVQYVEENMPVASGPDRPAPTPAVLNRDKPDPLKNLKKVGISISNLPGWTVQQQTLDAVDLEALLVPSAPIKPAKKKEKEKHPKPKRYDPSTGPIEPIEAPEPTLGESVLKLEIRPKLILSPKDDKPLPAPSALERTYLAVSSPSVRLQPGSWVRISGWVHIPKNIAASADGFLLFDNVGEEAMGLRLTTIMPWKQIHLYRQVPPSGVVWVTAALTGIGTVYIDDLKIEPMVQSTSSSSPAARVATKP